MYFSHKTYWSHHNTPPLDRILSYKNSLHTSTSHLFKIHFNIILPSTPRSSKVCLASGFLPNRPYAFHSSRTRVTYPTCLRVLDFIVLLLVGQQYKIMKFCQARYSSLGPNTSHCTLFLKALRPSSYLNVRDRSFTVM